MFYFVFFLACDEEDEMTCKDKSCVRKVKQCDFMPDCADREDEDVCGT